MADNPAQGAGPYTAPPPEEYIPIGTDHALDPRVMHVSAPGWTYITRDDRLRLRVYANTSSQTFTIHYRILKPDKQIARFKHTTPSVTAGGAVDFYWDLTEGFLLSVYVEVTSQQQIGGTMYAQVCLVTGGVADANPTMLLCSDYVTGKVGVGWPATQFKSVNYDIGLLESLPVTQPAAGADWTFPQPGGAFFRLIGGVFKLVTDATAGNRTVYIDITTGGLLAQRWVAAALVAPSTTIQFWVTNGAIHTASPTDVAIPISTSAYVMGGHTIKSTTVGIGAADQYSLIRLQIEDIPIL